MISAQRGPVASVAVVAMSNGQPGRCWYRQSTDQAHVLAGRCETHLASIHCRRSLGIASLCPIEVGEDSLGNIELRKQSEVAALLPLPPSSLASPLKWAHRSSSFPFQCKKLSPNSDNLPAFQFGEKRRRFALDSLQGFA